MQVRKNLWGGVLVLLALLLALPTTSALAEIGRIKRVTAPAFVERSGERIEAAPGLKVEETDILITGTGGRIAVTFIDNARFSVGPESRVTLSKFRFDSTSHDGLFETSIQAGRMAVVSGQIAKKTPDAMRVVTPTSILGVRGTRFIVEVGQ